MALTIKKNVRIARKGGSSNVYGKLVTDVAEILEDLVESGEAAVIPPDYNEDLYNDSEPVSDDDDTARGPGVYRLAVARALKMALLNGQLGYTVDDATEIALSCVFDVEGDIVLRAKHDPDLPAKREARNEATEATKAENAEAAAKEAAKEARASKRKGKAKAAPVDDDEYEDADEAPKPVAKRRARRKAK